MRSNTDKEQLAAQLFDAVLGGDEDRVRKLVMRGADPNSQVGDRVSGILRKELKINTAHQLAQSLKQDHIIQLFSQRKRNLDLSSAGKQRSTCCRGRKLKDRTTKKLRTTSTVTKATVGVHSAVSQVPSKIDINPGTTGYVCIFNYNSFQNGSNSHNLMNNGDMETKDLLDAFERIGYSGILHHSLSEAETKEAFDTLVDLKKLKEGQCVVFIIRGYAPYPTSVFTSDWRLFQFNDVIRSVTSTSNVHVKHLRKLFVFYTNKWCTEIVCDPAKSADIDAAVKYKPAENSNVASLYFESQWPKSSSSGPLNSSSFIKRVCENIGSHTEIVELVDLASKLQNATASNGHPD